MAVKMNPKASAWDAVGGMFWRKGRKSARPSRAELQMFLAEIGPGERCGILGASTKELIEAAVVRQLGVVVFDFSTVMLQELQHAIGANSCAYVCLDLLESIPDALRSSVRFVLADRLINRFSHHEVPVFLRNALTLLLGGGELRMTVKLGLYPMDLLLIDEGRRRGTLKRFYDEETRTIDYGSARQELEVCLVPHGSIRRDVLLDWYVGRGKESRFDHETVIQMLADANENSRLFHVTDAMSCPDAPATFMYKASLVEKQEIQIGQNLPTE